MTDPCTPDPLLPRVRELLLDAASRLDPLDYAARLAYCETTGNHGTTMHFDTDDDLIEFRWGSKALAIIPRDMLLDIDQPLPEPELVAELPDTAPPEWTAE